MFGELAEKFSVIFSSVVGKKKLTEENIAEAVRKVRLALLDADVNYTVAKGLIKKVKEKALGDEVIKSVSAGEQFIKVLHDELVALMGGGEASFELKGAPSKVMLCGLQGSGKTTHAAKLANYFKSKNPLLVACDLARPAAVEQLQSLGQKSGVSVFALEGEKNPVKVAKKALSFAKEHGHQLVIFDTAGRLHIDDDLMKQLKSIKEEVKADEVLFVANGATGQDAVKTATEFDQRIGISGSILTMLDGDARGGAAISIRQVTGKPLVFEGVGEKLDDLQLFHATSMADRIMGMGDTINLVKKAKEVISEKEVEELEKKMRKSSFTYSDYLKQIQAVKKMGSLKGLMKMLPGMPKLPDFDDKEKEFFKVEAMIQSMTPIERDGRVKLCIHRSKRIARGSGVDLGEVNKLKKSFQGAQKLFKGNKGRKMMDQLAKNKKFGGMDKLWR